MFYDFLCTAAAVLDWQFEFWATILALRSFNIIDMIKNFRERWPFHLIFHVMLEVLCELMLPTRIWEKGCQGPKPFSCTNFLVSWSHCLKSTVEPSVLVHLYPAIKFFVLVAPCLLVVFMLVYRIVHWNMVVTVCGEHYSKSSFLTFFHSGSTSIQYCLQLNLYNQKFCLLRALGKQVWLIANLPS